MKNKLFALLALVVMAAQNAAAAAYFTLPTDFVADTQLTIVGIAGGILVILGLMLAWRKTIKSVNRS